MKLLLVKTSSMGDVIHTFPAVTDALAALPGLTIDWLVERPFAPIARLHPRVGEVIEVETRRWRKTPFSAATRAATAALEQRLTAARYDLVVDAQGLMKSAWLARKAGAPVAGFNLASAREGLAAFSYRRRYAVPRDLHAIRRTRLLFAAALGYRPDLERLDYGLDRAEPDPARMAFLLHGTSWETKKWPVANWIAVANGLVGRGMRPCLTWSDEAEQLVAETIAAAVPTTLVIPKSGLDHIAGLLSRAALAIGVDTGLTHLAAAYGLPTVALYTATRTGLTGALGARTVALSAVSDDAAQKVRRGAPAYTGAISPVTVLETANRLLST
ncbi:MAG: lipopolysaccharide heptosyltransferase I [Rhizobiaceae bacterium]